MTKYASFFIGGLQPGLLLIIVLVVLACEQQQSSTDLRKNIQFVQQGKQLFQNHCSACHGNAGIGDPDWRQPEKDGSWPAPPLNGSGHTWHHPQIWLIAKIKKGGLIGNGKMPAWQDKLNDQQILSLLAYIQSLWPEKTYEVWTSINNR